MSDFKSKYPNVSRFQKSPAHPLRWRYQKHGKAALIPAGLEPFTPEFDAAYAELIAPRPQAEVVRLPTAALPATFRAAWRLVLQSIEWQELDSQTKFKNERLAEEFLAMPIVDGQQPVWGDMQVTEMKYGHLVGLIKRWSEKTPTKPWHMKTMLKKLFREAGRMEWMVGDPLGLVTWKRGCSKDGHKAWPDAIRAQFEAHHPIGTAARTAYALALYTSARRGDVIAISWDQLITVKVNGELVEGFQFEQDKQVQSEQDMTQFRPLFDELSEALSPLDRSAGGTVLKNAWGKPFGDQSLSVTMKNWCAQAGIPAGYTLHGLRKAHAAILAASGATLQEQMNMLGHTTPQQVANYAKTASKPATTLAASKKLAGKFRVAK